VGSSEKRNGEMTEGERPLFSGKTSDAMVHFGSPAGVAHRVLAGGNQSIAGTALTQR
jgi:hypothetical protein